MRILIVHPRLELHFEALMPGEVGEKWIQVPALGCLYLREVAREEGHQADYLDADALDLSAEQVGRHAAEGRYDVVGVQLNSYNLYAGVAAARAVRAALPEAVLCAGGVHPTIFPVETANLPEFDAAFAGEAEENFPAFLRAVENRDRPAIPGLAWKGGADPGPARVVNDIDRIPIPKTDGLPLHRYWSALARSRPVMPMVTSRGCPFQCTFCDRPLVDNGLRHRSIDNVIAEIEMRVGAGIREFCFYDDTLTANKKRVKALCDALAGLPRKIRFDCRSRVDTADVYEDLARAGCDRVYFGVESGDPDVLHRIKKYTNPDQVRRAVRAAQKAGLRTLGYFMIGLPDEDEEAARRTIELARSLKTDFALIELFIPMPKTEAYNEGLSTGLITHDYWTRQATAPAADFAPPPWPGELADRGQDLVREAYRRVYMTPSYIVRSLFAIRTFEEARQKVAGFFRFLKLRPASAAALK